MRKLTYSFRDLVGGRVEKDGRRRQCQPALRALLSEYSGYLQVFARLFCGRLYGSHRPHTFGFAPAGRSKIATTVAKAPDPGRAEALTEKKSFIAALKALRHPKASFFRLRARLKAAPFQDNIKPRWDREFIRNLSRRPL